VKRSSCIWLCCLGFLLSACTGSVQSAHLIFSGVYHIAPQNNVDSLLVQFDGATRLDAATAFTGTTFIIGGAYELAGDYNGALTIFGGNLTVSESANVDGVLNIGGGTVTLHPDATVSADIREGDMQIPRLTLTTGSALLDDTLWFLHSRFRAGGANRCPELVTRSPGTSLFRLQWGCCSAWWPCR
jgi:hypothetical protein